MAHTSRSRSTASRVFVVLLVAAVVIGALVAVFLVIEAQRSIRAEAERVTAATSASFAASPLVIDGLRSNDQGAATQVLEPYSLDVIAGAGSTSSRS